MSLQPHATPGAMATPRPGPSALERHIIRLASDHSGLMIPNLDARGFDEAFVSARPAVRRTLGTRSLPAFLASLERKAATVPDAGGCRLSFVVARGPASAMVALLVDGRTREILSRSYARHLAGEGADVALSSAALDPGHAVALGPGGIRAVARASAMASGDAVGASVGLALAEALPNMDVGAPPEPDGTGQAVAHVIVVATRGEGGAHVRMDEDAVARFVSDAGHVLAPSRIAFTHVEATLSGAVAAMSREMLSVTLREMREEAGIPSDEPPEVIHCRFERAEVVVVAEYEGYVMEAVHLPMALVSRDLEGFASDLADLAAEGRMVTYDEGEEMLAPGPHAPLTPP